MNVETRTFLYGLMLVALGWYICHNGFKCEVWQFQLLQWVIGTMCIALGINKTRQTIL